MLTLKEMNELVEQYATQRNLIKEKRDELKKLEDVSSAQEAAILEALQDNGLQNYRSPHGLVSVTSKTSVRLPQTPEDKEAFYNYLKSRGIFDTMISVNSMTLNSWYKAEFANAIAEGNEDFKIAGLNEVTITPQLSLRKA